MLLHLGYINGIPKQTQIDKNVPSVFLSSFSDVNMKDTETKELKEKTTTSTVDCTCLAALSVNR